MGRKYVIEIDEEHPFVRRDSHTNEAITLYPVNGFNALVFDDVGLQRLMPLDTYIRDNFNILGWMSYDKGWNDCRDKIIENVERDRIILHDKYMEEVNGQRISEDS